MRRLALIVVSCAFLISLSAHAQQAATWDLSRDLQISFTQGANGVWYFMEGGFGVHDPAVYSLLPKYLNPCQGGNKVFAGVGCWQGTEAHLPDFVGCCGLKTEVGFNFTNKPVGGTGTDIFPGYLPHTPKLAATWDKDAIVAWQSPLTGTIKVSATFLWRNIISIGMDCFVDKGNQTLRSRHIGPSNPEPVKVAISQLPVVKGDVLYFLVHNPFPDYFTGNPIDLRVRITQVP